jgi:hypothetical protein
VNIQDNQLQKELCEIIIRHLYGNDIDVEQYKVFHNPYTDTGDCDLRGVDITGFDNTTEIEFGYSHSVDIKVIDALSLAGFDTSGRQGEWWRDADDRTFKAIFDSRVSRVGDWCGTGNWGNKSVLAVYEK